MINRQRTTFYGQEENLAQSWGVPITVNPTIMKGTGAETEKLGLKMRVGPDAVSVVKRNINQQLAESYGVPVLVDPVLAAPTGAEKESLNIKGRIGPDAVSAAFAGIVSHILRRRRPSSFLSFVGRSHLLRRRR